MIVHIAAPVCAVSGSVLKLGPVGYFKIAVCKPDIFKMTAFSAAQMRKFGAARMNIIKINIADSFTTDIRIFADLNCNGRVAYFIHNDIIKGEIFDKRFFSAHIGRVRIVSVRLDIRQHDGYAAGAVGHDKIGEGAVAYRSVVDPTDTDSRGVAGQIAVGDNHLFAHLIFGKGDVVSAHDEAIVAACQRAV